MEESDKKMCIRITELRQILNLNKKEMADRLNIGISTISDIERFRIGPSKEVIARLIQEFNINSNWLLTGFGSPFVEDNDEKDKRIKELQEKIEELERTQSVDMEDAQIMIQKDSRVVEFINFNHQEIAFIDLINQKVSAGPGQEVLDEHTTKKIPILADLIYPHKTNEIKAVEVNGDSMTKIQLFDGDIVFYVPGLIKGDGIYVISICKDTLVKRLEFDLFEKKVTIISENDRYPEKKILPLDNDILKIEGKVKGWIHKHPY